jgi:hypothetical protein
MSIPGNSSRVDQALARGPAKRPPLPSPFNDKTREVHSSELLAAVRSAPGPGRSLFDEPTRLGDVDEALLEASRGQDDYPPQFLPATTDLAPVSTSFDETDERTRLANVDAFTKRPAKVDERTRAVDIRTDPSISDIDWDID